jgi:hypothetical protein
MQLSLILACETNFESVAWLLCVAGVNRVWESAALFACADSVPLWEEEKRKTDVGERTISTAEGEDLLKGDSLT